MQSKKSTDVSIIIPVYNTAKYLRECLDSAVNQSLRSIEVICVDDGSTDGSTEILQEYAAQDERVKVFRQKNSGSSVARNLSIKNATGKYIYFLDSDDLLKPDALTELVEHAESKDTDVLYFDCDIIYDSEEAYQNRRHVTEDYYKRNSEYGEYSNGCSLFAAMMENNEYRCNLYMQLIKRTHLINNNISFFEGIIHQDDLFTFLCILQAGKVAHINKSFYTRRVRSGSVVTSKMGGEYDFRSYLYVYMNIEAFVSQNDYPVNVKLQIDKYREAIQYNMRTLFSSAESSITWLDSLSKTERQQAKRILQLPHPDAELIRDVKEVVLRYGAKRVIWRAFKERIYQLCPQWLIRLYHKIRH